VSEDSRRFEFLKWPNSMELAQVPASNSPFFEYVNN